MDMLSGSCTSPGVKQHVPRWLCEVNPASVRNCFDTAPQLCHIGRGAADDDEARQEAEWIFDNAFRKRRDMKRSSTDQIATVIKYMRNEHFEVFFYVVFAGAFTGGGRLMRGVGCWVARAVELLTWRGCTSRCRSSRITAKTTTCLTWTRPTCGPFGIGMCGCVGLSGKVLCFFSLRRIPS